MFSWLLYSYIFCVCIYAFPVKEFLKYNYYIILYLVLLNLKSQHHMDEVLEIF